MPTVGQESKPEENESQKDGKIWYRAKKKNPLEPEVGEKSKVNGKPYSISHKSAWREFWKRTEYQPPRLGLMCAVANLTDLVI